MSKLNSPFLKTVCFMDLILVSLWALFLLYSFEPLNIMIFPFVVIRIASTFTLQLRERRSIIPVFIFIAVTLLSPLFLNVSYDNYIIKPFARMYDYATMLLAGKSTLLEGVSNYMDNPGGVAAYQVPGWKFFSGAYMAWLIFAPLAVYLYLLYRRKLQPSRWNWIKIGLSVVIYELLSLSLALLMLLKIVPSESSLISRLWWISLLLTPVLARWRWHGLSLWCRRYIVSVSLFSIAAIAGISMEPVASLIGILVSLPLFYYFVGYVWIGGKNKRNLRQSLYLLVISGLAFWTAQYGAGVSRALLLVLSVGLTCGVTVILWSRSRKTVASLTILTVCSVILPSIALGYNQFVCFDAKRLFNFTDYGYSCRGLLMVRDGKYYAIRDRYGYILPPKYEGVKFLGERSKPFVKIKEDGKWGIYDLERQEVVIEPYYVDIIQYGKNSWKLMDKYSSRTGWHDFFVSPNYYSRYRKCGIVSDCPFEHGLSLPLRYDYKVRDAESVDLLLTEMINGLWERSDTVSLADFYWDWARDVSSTIDRLHTVKDIFHTYNGLYNNAMENLKDYIEMGNGGYQSEMNATSYVLATMENYMLIHATQELDDSMPNVDIRREYTLFNEFMSAYEDWEIKCKEYQEWYSDRAREENEEALYRFKARRTSIEDMIAVVKGDTIIPSSAKAPQTVVDRSFNNLLSNWNNEANELVLPIKDNFKRWIAYRREIEAGMPRQIAVSYRNQTNQLEKFYTSDKFL